MASSPTTTVGTLSDRPLAAHRARITPMSADAAEPAPAPVPASPDAAPTTTISEARLRAARANALRSTGPRNTAMTKFNAYRHGLSARVIHTSEEHRLILLLAAALEPTFAPRTPRQHDLLREIATGRHRLGRARELQALARED